MSGILAALATYAMQVLAPAAGLFVAIWTDGQYGIAIRLLLELFVEAFSVKTFGLSALIGINVGLILFYIVQRRAAPASGITGGIAGSIAAVFGIGCAACGSTLAIALFGAGSGGLVTMLPYNGAWLGDVGLIILTVSAVFTIRAIRKPLVCEI